MNGRLKASIFAASILIVGATPSLAAPTSDLVWVDLANVMRPMPMPMDPGVDLIAAINRAEPGNYLDVLSRAQTRYLDRACTVVLADSRYARETERFCTNLKDEIEDLEDDEDDES